MARFLKENGPLLLALGSGIIIGTSGTILYYRLSRNVSKEVAQLAIKLESLSREVKELRATVVSVAQARRKRARGYYSVHASSGEEDDEYEEALEDNSIRREPFAPLQTTLLVKNEPDSSAQNGSIPIGDIESIYAKVDQYLDGNDRDREQAYNLLVEKVGENDKNANLLWRLAKASTFMAQIEGARGNANSKQSLTYSSLEHAKNALTLDAKNANVHKWYAITLGNIGDYEGTSAKIQNGYDFKTHIEKAISLNPVDPSSHYLLGRWSYGVYMLSWIERKAAAALYATPPSASVDDALKHFMKAEDLSPGKWKDNMLYIGKCYVEKRDYSKAVQWLDKASAVPIVGQDDRDAQTEVDRLLYKYSGYRM